MEEDYNVFDLLFEKKEEEDKFVMQDEKLLRYRRKVSESSEKLYKCIDDKVHPRCREELKKLIENRNNDISDSYYRQFQLYYKHGIIDGINIILNVLVKDK